MDHLPTRCSSSVIHNDLVFIVTVQYYGDIIRPLVTQPLSNRQKKTGNDKSGQKNSREALFPAILRQASINRYTFYH
ncbi:hypothetical protein EAJ10_06305 [Bacteroides thetaiotaomicron]|uniref:Uncharacterized protein n=1 Tax=Bacteroides thetaiotaomicron TaxID=818 RepID=A0A7J5JBV9_BACT4|nr:hypothetical protein GAN94_24285 [Bacteroides thetaiotaomicron]KAB4426846.1 hypothetical protein GAO03_22805 [Bacteroides thetaiotaomicron]KAB4429269.1 hypothetical protein GAN87_23510 [Bacteroides thetaiotaomicron]KAB4441535.1 hypothetical protein GAN99_06340 [Bacteroides thetaiotaomicron]KAB4448071.1 hypothetical protein GAN93_22815 [Bacteroides thetaiotaomicron]